jgi:putative phosphoesterase
LKFGLTGDTHNNFKNIEIICSIFNDEKVDFVIHTGDISLPKSLSLFSKLKMPLKGVYGNNDIGEKDKLNEVCKKEGFIFEDELKIDLSQGKFLYVIHDPKDIRDSFFNEGNIIVHGHTHRFRDEIIKNTFLFNPGECAGIMKGMNRIGVVYTEIPKMDIFKF